MHPGRQRELDEAAPRLQAIDLGRGRPREGHAATPQGHYPQLLFVDKGHRGHAAAVHLLYGPAVARQLHEIISLVLVRVEGHESRPSMRAEAPAPFIVNTP